ncbi:MAG: SDR family oxidoreductase [Chlorobiota bacterium]|jgi:NAD(P)-dependent dehydrogenase (short-subunit alcohol dehydrogenase family)|nr:MAG: SDR family oxidoreductase [Chlorobiota bacterium]
MAQQVLITGAAGGLGQHVTQLFLNRGWEVIATALTEEEQRWLGSLPRCRTILCDVTRTDQVAQLAAELPPTLDAVVHLVGGIRAGKPIEDTADEDFHFMWQLNAQSTYLILRATLPILKRTAGSFVAIGAKTVLHTETNKALYGAAKAAVVHLVLAAAEEGRASGMRANVIVPSILRTEANLQWARNGEEQGWVDPNDVAEMIAFLCSDAARGVTGCIVPMYGKIPA